MAIGIRRSFHSACADLKPVIYPGAESCRLAEDVQAMSLVGGD